MGHTIFMVFYPCENERELFVKALNTFEVVGLIPYLDYIITGPDIDTQMLVDTGRTSQVKRVKVNERDKWIRETNSEDWTHMYATNGKFNASTGTYTIFLNRVMTLATNINLVIDEDKTENLVKIKDRLQVMDRISNLFSTEVSSFASNLTATEAIHAYRNGKNAPYDLPYFASGRFFQPGLIPQAISWINYWNSDTLEEIGFNPSDDKSLFYDATQMTKGWYLQLTKEPFNFENPVHLEILKRIYLRFKKIGGQDLIEQGLVPRG